MSLRAVLKRVLNDRTRIALRQTARRLIRCLYVFPIRKNRIVFESYEGKAYSCNPKYLSEYMQEKSPGKLELIWALKDPEHVETPAYVRKVRYESLKHIFYRVTARAIIQNMPAMTFVPVRRGQISINTWHAGGAYKKTGMTRTTHAPLIDYKRKMAGEQISAYLSSSDAFTRYNIETAYHYHGRVLKTGMPRNDLFFDRRKVSRAKEKVCRTYSIGDEYVVLYAPTYRGLYADASRLDIDFPFLELGRVLEAKYGKKVFFLKRMHYADRHRYADIPGVADASEYPDMQELLCAADLLVTDYSSSIWDYALLGRPCLLYAPDLDAYEQDPGFYVDIREWPGILCRSEQELMNAAEYLDEEECRKKAEDHLRRMGSYERGTACAQVCTYLFRHKKKTAVETANGVNR